MTTNMTSDFHQSSKYFSALCFIRIFSKFFHSPKVSFIKKEVQFIAINITAENMPKQSHTSTYCKIEQFLSLQSIINSVIFLCLKQITLINKSLEIDI